MSFGADRKLFKHKESKETVSRILQNGSLLVMKDETQSTLATSVTSYQTCW
jgi:hypothetical protein